MLGCGTLLMVSELTLSLVDVVLLIEHDVAITRAVYPFRMTVLMPWHSNCDMLQM